MDFFMSSISSGINSPLVKPSFVKIQFDSAAEIKIDHEVDEPLSGQFIKAVGEEGHERTPAQRFSHFIAKLNANEERLGAVGQATRKLHSIAEEVSRDIASVWDDTIENKNWVAITPSRDATDEAIWLQLDIEKGIIGFHSVPDISSATTKYIHSYTDAEGESTCHIYLPTYQKFRVKNKERLADPHFLQKLQILASHGTNNFKDEIIYYLNAEAMELPPAEKAPLLYMRSDQFNLQSQEDSLLRLALSNKSLTEQEVSLPLRRLQFLQALDKSVAALSDRTQPLSETSFATLQILGNELTAEGGLSADEVKAFLKVLKLAKGAKDDLAEQPSEDAFEKVDLPENRVHAFSQSSESNPEKNEAIDHRHEIKTTKVEEVGDDISTEVEGEKEVFSRHDRLVAAQEDLQQPKTMASGLELLKKWSDHLSDEYILCRKELSHSASKKMKRAFLAMGTGLAHALPLMPKGALNSLTPEELGALLECLGQLEQRLQDPFFKRIKKLPGTALEKAEMSALAAFVAVLLGQLGGEAAAALLLKISSPDFSQANGAYTSVFSADPFVKGLHEGLILKDPLLQEKARRLASSYLGATSGPLLDHLDEGFPAFRELSEGPARQKPFEQMLLFGMHIVKDTSTHDILNKKWLEFDRARECKHYLDKGSQWINKKVHEIYTTAKNKSDAGNQLIAGFIFNLPGDQAKVKEGFFKKLEELAVADKVDDQEFDRLLNALHSSILNKIDERDFIDFKRKAKEFCFYGQKIRSLQIELLQDELLKDLSGVCEAVNKYSFVGNKFALTKNLFLIKETLKEVKENLFKNLLSPLPAVDIELNSQSQSISDEYFRKLGQCDLSVEDLRGKLQEAVAFRGLPMTPFKPSRNPTDEQLSKLWLITSDDETKNTQTSFAAEALNFIARNNHKNPFLRRNYSCDDLSKPLDEQIEGILRYLSQSKHSNLGFHRDRKDANEIANDRDASPLVKECAALSSNRRDQAWLTVQFMLRHPRAIEHKAVFEELQKNLFEFHSVGHLVEGEDVMAHKLMSEAIPRAFASIIDELKKKMKDPHAKNKRKGTTIALARTLALAAQLRDYAEARNPNFDLSKHIDYRAVFYQELGPTLDLKVAQQLTEVLPMLFFSTLAERHIQDPSLKDAILFYKAGCDYQEEVCCHPYYQAIDALAVNNKVQYENHYLTHFVRGELNVDKSNLVYTANGHVSVDGKSARWDRRKETLMELGLQGVEVDPWYLIDHNLNGHVMALLGKGLKAFSIQQEGVHYLIKGTDYRFDRNGNVYLEYDGEPLLYKEINENPLGTFGLEYDFDASKDHCFFSANTGTQYIMREGRLRYRSSDIGEKALLRAKDNALCVASEPAVWYKKGPEETYQPFSFQIGLPPLEYKFVTSKDSGTARLESLSHPGYFLSKKPALCCGADLKKVFGERCCLLESDEGDQILIGAFKDASPQRWVEFRLTPHKITTKDPWDLVALLVRTQHAKLILEHYDELHLSSPRGWQTAVSDVLAQALADEGRLAPQAFGAWMALVLLDTKARGHRGGLTEMSVDKLQPLFLAYQQYKHLTKINVELKAPREVERLFLNEWRSWFSQKKSSLMNELKELKDQAAAEKKGFLEGVVTYFENLLPGLGSQEITEKQGELDGLRIIFRELFKPSVLPQWHQLMQDTQVKDKHAKVDTSLLAAASSLPKRLDLLQEAWSGGEEESTSLFSKINDLIPENLDYKQSVKELYNQLPAHPWKTWGTIKEEFNASANKESYLHDNLLELFNLARTIGRQEKKEFLDLLDVTFAGRNKEAKWLTTIAQKPGRYPQVQKLIKDKLTFLQSQHRLEMQKVKLNDEKVALQQQEQQVQGEIYAATIERYRLPKGDEYDAKNKEITRLNSRSTKLNDAKEAKEKKAIAIDKQILQRAEKHEKACRKACSIASLWECVRGVASLIFTAVGMLFKLSELRKPLKLSQASLSKPHFFYKKGFKGKDDSSPIKGIDEKFDQAFENWRDNLLQEQPRPRDSGQERKLYPDDDLTQKAQRDIEEYRELAGQKCVSLKPDQSLDDFAKVILEAKKNCVTQLKTM